MELREGRRTGDLKRRARLRVGGGGGGARIEGIIVWGGTLAIVSLMALFTIRVKKRVSSRCTCGPEKLKVEATEEEGGGGGGGGDKNGGLRVVLQDQSSPTSPLTPRNSSCCIGGSHGGSSRTDLAHLVCSDSVLGQSSTSEEKPAVVKDEKKEPHQETVFSAGVKTERVASFSSVVEDGSPPATQDSALATDDWNENTENHLEKQIIHASSEVDAFDRVAQIEVLTAEADESVDSVEDEVEEEEDLGGGDDEKAEEVEGSSEGSGDSCLELNNEAIWPLEMIDEVAKTIIEDRVDMTKINKQESDSIVHEEGEEENVGVDTSENPSDSTAFAENGLEETVTRNRWKTRFPRPPIWIWRVLLLLVLLSLLVHGSSIGSSAMNRCDLAVK
ncbi:hypothetical protein NL676_022378 [Syzygium grande]|nr:hypothetical protein NL676_022378 [Syzygium grande]